MPDYLLTHPPLNQQNVSWEDITEGWSRDAALVGGTTFRRIGVPLPFDAQSTVITELAVGVAALDRRARALL